MTPLEYLRKSLMSGSIEVGKWLARPFYKNENWPYSHEDLSKLPEGSIGRKMGAYLDGHHFRLVEGYEPHDVKHILTGYEMDTLGEVRLQFFLYGNGNETLPVLFTLAFGMCIIPEHLFTFWDDYQRGKRTKSLFFLDYAALVAENLTEIQRVLLLNEGPSQSRSLFQVGAAFLSWPVKRQFPKSSF